MSSNTFQVFRRHGTCRCGGVCVITDIILICSYDRWIAGKISGILGNDDDVVIELCFNLLEGSRFVRLYCTSASNTIELQHTLTGLLCCFLAAGYQTSTNSAHWLFGQGYTQVLQGALEFMPQRAKQSARRT